jgi:peptide/nickel transport system substrate-binding protein
MRQKVISRRLGAAFAAALLAGCGAVANSSPSAHATPTVVVAIGGTPNFWFPMNSAPDFTELNGEMNHLMYLPLVNVSHTNAVSFQQAVAQRVVANATGTVYKVYLKPGLKWSDGRPVTARDVVFAWNVMDAASQQSPAPPWTYGGAGMGGVPTRWASVVAQGAHEVVVTLKEPTNPQWFEHNGLTQIFPMPAFKWNRYPDNMTQELRYIANVASNPTNPIYRVVDGPYKFSKTSANQFWDFVPNPSYYGKRATYNVDFQYFTSTSAQFAALKKDTLQIGTLPLSLYDSRSQLSNDHLREIYSFGFNYITPNESAQSPVHGAFRLTYVRQALEMGINQAAIIKHFYHGLGVPAYDQVPSEPPTVFDVSNVPALTYNPAAAKNLLTSHGWRLANGVMTNGSIKLQFTMLYPSGSTTTQNIAEYLANTWAQIGVKVNLVPESGSTIFAESTQSQATKWAMADFGGWIYGPDFYPTGGEFYLPNSGANNEGYSSREMTHLIDNTYISGTPAQIQSRFRAFLSYEAQQAPVLYMPYTPGLYEVANSLTGFTRSFNPITGFYYPNYWQPKS